MTATDAFGILAAVIAALIAYIFTSFRSDTQGRFAHQDKLIETMVANNVHLSQLIDDHDYRIRTVEARLKIEATQSNSKQ